MRLKRYFWLATLLLAGLTTRAQIPATCADSATITFGASGSSWNSMMPFRCDGSAMVYPKSGSWQLITAAELEELDIYPGSSFRSIAFNRLEGYGTDTVTVDSVRIYMAETPLTAFATVADTLPIGQMSLVATVPHWHTVVGWNTIVFDTAYQWSGSGSLVIAVVRDSLHGELRFERADNTISLGYYGTTTNTSVRRNGARTKMRFDVCVAWPDCRRPLSVTTAATDSSLSVSWSGNASAYQIVVGPTGFCPDSTDTTGLVVTAMSVVGNSYTFTNIPSGTFRDVYVRGLCGDDTSLWSHCTSIHIPCPEQSLPYTETFDDAVAVSACWYLHRSSVLNSSGTSLSFYYSGALNVLPAFDQPLNKLHISFLAHSYSGTPRLAIGVITDPDDPSTFVVLDTIPAHIGPDTPNITERERYQSLEGDLCDYTGPEGRLAIMNLYQQSTRIDSVVVDTLVPFYVPYDLAADSLDYTSATLSWRSRFGRPATYQLAYGLASGGEDPDSCAIVSLGDTLSHTLTGLTPGESYHAYVRAISPTDTSDWCYPLAFTTDGCAEVTDLTVDSIGDTTVTLSWNEGGHASQWMVDYTAVDSGYTGHLIVDTTTATITGLSLMTRYSIGVRALCLDSLSSVATEIGFSTPPDGQHRRTRAEIGTDSPNSINTATIPANRLYLHSWTQTIYTQLADMEIAGIIDTLWYYCNAVGTQYADTAAVIYLGHTQAVPNGAYTPWVPMGDLQEVWRGTDATAHSVGWHTIPLQHPFEYNGQDNIAVVFGRHSDAYTTNHQYKATNATIGATITYYSDTDTNCAHHPGTATLGDTPMSSSSSSDRMPVVQFSFLEELGGCVRVGGLHLDGTSGHDATIGWTERGTATQWQVAYANADSTIAGDVVVGTNPCVLSGLPGNETYSVQVRPICGEGDTGRYMGGLSFELISCPDPTEFVVDNVGADNALLSWSGTATQWAVGLHSAAGDTIYITTAHIIPLTGLLPDMDYTATLRAVCGEGDSGQATMSVSFRTWIDDEHRRETIQAGNGIANGWNAPFNAYWKHAWTQMIYPKEMIGTSGVIDTLWFHCATVGDSGILPQVDTSVTVYMGLTDLASAPTYTSWVPQADLAMMCHAAVMQPADTGWFPIALDMPFVYDSSMNLCICVSHHGSTYSSSWKYSFTESDNAFICRRNDDDYSYGEYPGTASANYGGAGLPNLRLSMVCGPVAGVGACAKPTEVTADRLDEDMALITWDGGDATQWQVAYGPATESVNDMTAVDAYTDSMYITGLVVGQSYTVYVRTDCGDGVYSLWSPCTITPGTHAPLGGYSSDTLRTCYVELNMPAPYYINSTIVLVPNTEGTLMSLSGPVNLGVDYMGNITDARLRVYDGIGTDGDLLGTWMGDTAMAPIVSVTGPLTIVYTGNQSEGQPFTLVAHCVEDNGCRAVGTVRTLYPADTAVDILWNYDPASLPATFTVAYAPYDTFDTATASYLTVTVPATAPGPVDSTHEFHLTGLTPGTCYLVAVRADCDAATHSRWTIAAPFRTACAAIPHGDLPWSEDFSTWGTPNSINPIENVIDPCWAITGTGTDRCDVEHWNTPYYNDTVYDYVTLSCYHAFSVLALPLFEDELDSLTLAFDIRNDYTYGDMVVFEVGVMDDPHDTATFATVLHDTILNADWRHYAVSLGGYVGQGRHMAFRTPAQGARIGVRIANVRVSCSNDTIPVTPEPDTVWRTVVALSADEAMGTVGGGGTYPDGSVVTLTATPNGGYLFDRWDDGVALNPRTLTVVSDTTFTALFVLDAIDTTGTDTTGIAATADGIAVTLYPNPASATVTVGVGTGEATVALFGLDGRRLGEWRTEGGKAELDLAGLAGGAYFVAVTTPAGTATRKLIVR